MRKFFRATYSVAVISLFLAAVIIGFTQTKIFRSYLRTKLVQVVANDLHGELEMSSLEGNLFTGFRAENVVLRRDGDPVATIEQLEVKYDPLGMFTKSATVARLVLTNPSIHLTRTAAGEWNFERFLRSSGSDTTPSSWTINLKQIRISGGALEMIDSLGLARQLHDSSGRKGTGEFNYARLSLDSLNLEGSLMIRSGETSVSLRSFACRSSQPQFRLRNIAGDLVLDSKSVSVRKLRLETEKSKLLLDARFDGVNVSRISALAQLNAVPISVRLNVERLDFGELKQIIGSSIDFLDREVNGQIDLEGRFGLIDVRNVTLHTGSSVVRIAGTLANLHMPRNLELDLACIRNRIDPVDLRYLMPTLRIPDLAALGPVDYDLRFRGKPTSFNAKLTSNSQIGKVDVDGNIAFHDSTMSYDGTIKTTRFNITPLLRSPVSPTRPVLPGPTATEYGLKLDVKDSYPIGVLLGREILGDFSADCRFKESSDGIEWHGTADVHEFSYVDKKLRFLLRDASLSYGAGGLFALDAARPTVEDGGLTSKLNATITVQGRGTRLAEMTSLVRVVIDSSEFAGLPVSRSIVVVDVADKTIRPRLSLRVGLARIDLGGTLQLLPQDLIQYDLSGRINSLNISDITGKREHDSDVSFDVQAKGTLRTASALSAEIALNVFRSSIDTVTFDGGSARILMNTLDQESGTLDLKSDIVDLNVLGHFTPATLLSVLVDGAGALGDAVRYRINALDSLWTQNPADMLRSIKVSVDVKAKQFDLQDIHASNPTVSVEVTGANTSFSFGALLDSLVTVDVDGRGEFSDHVLALHIARLRADFSTSEFMNSEPVQIDLGRGGFQIGSLRMKHGGEELWAAGRFDPAGVSDVSVSVKDVNVGNIPRMFRRPGKNELPIALSGLVNAAGTFQGTFEEPRFAGEMNATGLGYQGQNFGKVVLRSSYADRILNIFAQLHSQADSVAAAPELLVNGTVPYDLSLKGESSRKLEGEMNLDVQSTRFPLEFLDPFIPELSELTGSLVCNMKLRGTVQSPTYEGSVAIQNARFHFDPLGISYIVNGRLVPQGRQIGFQDMTVRNIPEDRPDGKIELSGGFTLEGLKIRDFDLIAKGQLLVMKESARMSSQGLYGDLFAGMGPDGISWKGRPSHSTVEGEVFVKYANLTLPPTRQAQDLPNSGIKVSVIDDLATEKKATAIQSPVTNPRSVKTSVAALPAASPEERSFLDNIVYHLSVETQGVTQLRFVFSNFTNEQLFADLKGRTVFTKDGDQMYLSGELDLGNRSYYNNFKKLDATGKVKFTGDPLNPELNVVASFEGVHRDTTGISASGSGAFAGGTKGTYQKVIVRVYITGTREQPKVKMGLEQYDQLGNLRPERADVQADALAFLVTGAFPEEFTQQDRLSLAGSNVLGGVASSILSGPLTDLLRKELGYVKSVDVLYYGGGTIQESADVRLTGEVGDAVFRLGGRVLSDLNNTNVSIQVPMSALIGSAKWHNLVLEAERRVEGVETIDQRRESRGLRLLYRIIF